MPGHRSVGYDCARETHEAAGLYFFQLRGFTLLGSAETHGGYPLVFDEN